MRFTPDNFLYTIKQLVTGLNGDSITDSGTANSNDGGIQRDVPLSLADVVILQTGTSVKLSTITGITAVPVIETTASDTSVGYVSVQIPRDYDEASDKFQLRLNVVLANADAGITFTGTPTITLPGTVPGTTAAVTKTAVSAVLPFATGTTAASLSTTIQTIEIQLNGFGLLRDNIISVLLAYVGTTSGVADIVSLQYKYDSTIVSYNETDTTDVPGGGANATGFGNILR